MELQGGTPDYFAPELIATWTQNTSKYNASQSVSQSVKAAFCFLFDGRGSSGGFEQETVQSAKMLFVEYMYYFEQSAFNPHCERRKAARTRPIFLPCNMGSWKVGYRCRYQI